MNLAPEPLGFRCGGSSPPLRVLIPASSLPSTPAPLTGNLQRAGDAPLPKRIHPKMDLVFRSFGDELFSPDHFRRKSTRLVSYYALFKGMAASKPTSQLSRQIHILYCHSVRTWGP